MGLSIIYFKGSQDGIFLRIVITTINSADPDEMLHFIRFIWPGSSMFVKVSTRLWGSSIQKLKHKVVMTCIFLSISLNMCQTCVLSAHQDGSFECPEHVLEK